MKAKRLLSATVLLAASALPLGLTAAAAGSASASTGGFHVSASIACNNPSSCDLPLGVLTISGPFNADGTASAQTTGTSHLQGGGPADGAQHTTISVANLNGQRGWFIGSDGNFWITNETDTFTGRGGPPVTVFDPFPPYPSDTGIPATPGHYTSTQVFGSPSSPGMHFIIQVTQVPG